MIVWKAVARYPSNPNSEEAAWEGCPFPLEGNTVE